jgi:hypothetical protein
MADRKNPFIEIGMPDYTGIHLMPFAMRERAETHERNRQRVVLSILLDIHLMALAGYVKEHDLLGLRGAVSQNLEGRADDATAAAHCVPRQLLIAIRTPQDILLNPLTAHLPPIPERSFALNVLFAETDILPVNFNIADSRAERMGLNAAFLRACKYTIQAAHIGGQMTAASILTFAANAFAIYKDEARLAFRAASERLRQKLKPTYLFPKEREKWTEQLQITEKYAETLQSSPTTGELLDIQKIEGLIRVYTLR